MSESHSKKQANSAFDDIYIKEDYSDIIARVTEHQIKRKRFLDLLQNTINQSPEKLPRILEIGCGTAIDLCTIADKANCIAYGIDISVEAVKIAERTVAHFKKPVHIIHADALKLPFEPEFFDIVFSQGVLEHFADDELALTEQLRVLKPGGKLVINVPQKYTMYTVAKHIRILKGTWPWGRETEYSYGRLKALGRKLGIRETGVMGYDYWLHPLEPAWMFRSIIAKLQKINPARNRKLCILIAECYDRLWSTIETKLGHRFMRNIVIVFEK